NRENQRAFLLHQSDALSTGAYIQMAGLEAVEFDAAGKGSDGAGNQAQQGGFAAGIRTEDGHEFAFAGLKGSGFEGEEWRGLFARRIGITGLLDIDAQVRRM